MIFRDKLIGDEQCKASLLALYRFLKPFLMSGIPYWIEVKEDTRSLPQNSRMWAMLTDVSRQVDWYGNRLLPAEWKDVFTASLKGQKVVPGLDGGFVVLGTRTSRMSKSEMSDLMELMSAFGAEKSVVFSDPSNEFTHHLTGEITHAQRPHRQPLLTT